MRDRNRPTKQSERAEGAESGEGANGAAEKDRALARKEKAMLIPKELKSFVDDGYDIVQTGGQTKWVDMEQFEDGEPEKGSPCKGNGKFIEGVLMGVQEIEALNQRTKQLEKRYFYNIQLVSPCPVNYKDEDEKDVFEDAQPGEIVALGERNKLAFLQNLCEDGGVYQVKIVPHSRIPIGGGQTLWTFNIGKKTLREPNPALVVRRGAAPF